MKGMMFRCLVAAVLLRASLSDVTQFTEDKINDALGGVTEPTGGSGKAPCVSAGNDFMGSMEYPNGMTDAACARLDDCDSTEACRQVPPLAGPTCISSRKISPDDGEQYTDEQCTGKSEKNACVGKNRGTSLCKWWDGSSITTYECEALGQCVKPAEESDEDSVDRQTAEESAVTIPSAEISTGGQEAITKALGDAKIAEIEGFFTDGISMAEWAAIDPADRKKAIKQIESDCGDKCPELENLKTIEAAVVAQEAQDCLAHPNLVRCEVSSAAVLSSIATLLCIVMV